MIRPARFGDIPRLAELMQEAAERSIYQGRASIDVRECKALFMRCLQAHGRKTEGGTLCLVAERDGKVEGVLIGMLDRVYHILDKLMATDLFFVLSERADPRDAMRLLRAFREWAEGHPEVIEICMGVSNALGDWQRAGKLFEFAGLELAGAIYQRGIER